MNPLYREDLAQLLLDNKYSDEIYGGKALTKLLFFPELEQEGELELRTAANWFLLPHPKGRDHQGEPDFTANKLIRALYMIENRLSEETTNAIHRFFQQWNFESKYKSENHLILFHASRYLYALKYPQAFFAQYQKSASQLLVEERQYLREFIEHRAKYGWAEFDSLGYAAESFLALLNLVDFAQPELAHYAAMSADLVLMDMLADCSPQGYYGGAHGRSKAKMVLDYQKTPMLSLYKYYFTEDIFPPDSIEMLVSAYVPGDYVYEMRDARPQYWENYECKHLHSITFETPHQQLPQVPGMIRKYTYVTPRYVMGAVNSQDDYPKGSLAAWYAHHEQHEWDLSLASGSDMRIFVHHPGATGPEGKEHGYWTGDLGCCCGQYYCRKNTVLATHNIPDGEEPMIHAHIPLEKLQIEIEGNYLWFADAVSGVYGMLWLSNGFAAGSEKYQDIELRSYGKKHGVVCTVEEMSAFESFEAFQKAKKATPISYCSESGILTYDEIAICGHRRMYRGEEVEFEDVTYRSPMMYEQWGSGIVELPCAVMDFNGWGTVKKR